VAASRSDPLPPAGWDLRVISCRRLLGSLEELLSARGYVLRPAPAHPAGSSALSSEFVGEKDSPKRDAAYLAVGIALLPTLLLTSLGVRFIRQSRYTFRTVAGIGVEGMFRPCPDAGAEDAPADVRVVLQVEAGAAREGGGIWRPTEDRREVARLADERRRLEQDITELLRSMEAPPPPFDKSSVRR
jgi:hypothetical protein